MKVTHEKLGIDLELPEILQRDLEKFERELQTEIKGVEGLQMAVYSGAVVRTSANLGWLEGIKADDVESMKPNVVAFLANAVSEHVRDAREVPPQ